MKRILPASVLILFLIPGLVCAQDIVKDPICFTVINEAPYTVFGNFITDYYETPEGVKSRHRSNFRLEEAGAVDKEKGFPLDRAEFCSYGPFMEGRKLEMVIRTLVPVFSCKTRIDQGPIIIKGKRKPEPEEGTETRAECFD